MAVREEIKRTAKDKKALDLHIVESALSPKEAFLSIYQTLTGKSFGPKAGWIILENKVVTIQIRT